jgi:hypothetical protein
MFRLFEQLSEKRDTKLYNSVIKIVEDSKDLCERNGYTWLVVEDFYNVIICDIDVSIRVEVCLSIRPQEYC